jgi:phosphatidylserine/phosphatidylglycerophosphate/cardiolipin synthase-like enzyme
MGLQQGGIELYMGPTALGAPDDLDRVVRDFIAGARSSLLVAVQELDSRSIADAILTAKDAGVRVQIILEGDYLVESPSSADPWTPGGGHETNRVIHSALLRAGIDVVTDLNPAIFHQKFVVRDADGDTAAVLTGSSNFTRTDTGTNPADGPEPRGNNLNHVLVLHGRRAAAQYENEFLRMRSGTFGELRERHEPRPAEFGLGKVRVKPLFAPRHGPEMEIMKQMLKASSSIDFAMFTFARSSGIDDTMLRLVSSVDRLRGVLDRGQGMQAWAATPQLRDAGVELFQNKPGTGVRKVHHKLMVIDERLVIAGSFNYTAPATTLNDENIIVLGDLEETDADAEAGQRRLARYALDEIERISSELATRV